MYLKWIKITRYTYIWIFPLVKIVGVAHQVVFDVFQLSNFSSELRAQQYVESGDMIGDLGSSPVAVVRYSVLCPCWLQ